MLLLFLCLASGREHFLPLAEYHLSILTSLAIAGLDFNPGRYNRLKVFLGAAVIILVSTNFHPVAIISLGFLMLYEWIQAGKAARKYWVVLGIFTAIIISIKSLAFPIGEYENNKMSTLSSAGTYLIRQWELAGLFAPFHYFYSLFPEIILLFFISIPILLLQRKFILGGITFLSAFSIFILLSVLRGVDETDIWYIEYFILAGVCVLLPLSCTALNHRSARVILPVLLLAAIVTCFVRIERNAPYFASRINYAERLNENGKLFPEKKYIVSDRNVPRQYIRNTWPLTFQTLLLSSFTDPGSAQSTIVLPDINSCDSLIAYPANFLGPEWSIEMFNYAANKLPKKYFNLPEKSYRKLTTSQQSFTAPDSIFNSSTILIKPTDSILVSSNDSIIIPVLEISNSSKEIIPAIPDNKAATWLCYHLFDGNGALVSWDNERTALETDVYKKAVTGITVYTGALKKGIYYLEFDILTEGIRWWGINSRAKLIVK